MSARASGSDMGEAPMPQVGQVGRRGWGTGREPEFPC